MDKVSTPSPKIALVKSELYNDLYNDTSNMGWRSVVLSSSMRSGPVGLFAYYDTRFIIIKQDSYATDYWKQKVTDCGQGSESDYFDESRRPLASINGLSKADVAISANDIDWSCFDIVIALDACISESITARFPDILWCYYISEGCMSEYAASRLQPVSGYKIFLNQRFRFESDYADDPNLQHEIDFPYHLMDSYSVEKLLGGLPPPDVREGIFIEKDTRPLLTEEHRNKLEEIGPICEASGSIEYVLHNMSRCKYFLRLGDRNVWGNASIEAVAAGLVLISSSRGYRNRIFGCNATVVSGIGFSDDQFTDAINKIRHLETNPNIFDAALSMDKQSLQRICMQYPMHELLKRYQDHCQHK